MVIVNRIGSGFFVWNHADITFLKDNRVLGVITNSTKENNHDDKSLKGIPLKLSIYEVLLLSDMNWITIHSNDISDDSLHFDHKVEQWKSDYAKEKTAIIPTTSTRNIKNEDLSILNVYRNQEYINYKYKIYNDLWNKGMFVQIGNTYGVDFVIYEQDPETVHSKYLVKCVKYDEEISCLDFVAAVRITNSVNKDLLMAYVNCNVVEYIKIEWEGVS